MDKDIRSIERELEDNPNDKALQVVYAVASRRRGLGPALERWMGLLNSALREGYEGQEPMLVTLDPSGRSYLRIVKGNGVHRSVYCFVEVATGNLLKPAGWKGPEKKIPRGNIHAWDCLAGCGMFGVAYANGVGNYTLPGRICAVSPLPEDAR